MFTVPPPPVVVLIVAPLPALARIKLPTAGPSAVRLRNSTLPPLT